MDALALRADEGRDRNIDFQSSGERNGKSPNPDACIRGLGPQQVTRILGEWFWESQPERVKAPYLKIEESERDPEYHETRETLWEGAGTTP